jgi:hypothetical protein
MSLELENPRRDRLLSYLVRRVEEDKAFKTGFCEGCVFIGESQRSEKVCETPSPCSSSLARTRGTWARASTRHWKRWDRFESIINLVSTYNAWTMDRRMVNFSSFFHFFLKFLNPLGIRIWGSSYLNEQYGWYLFHKEVKSGDSTTWFRIWQFQTTA